MKYTVTELSNILGVKQATIYGWINKGIISVHSHQEGEVVKLKVCDTIKTRGGKSGEAYLISAKDVDDFMDVLYYNSYFQKWWRK